MKPVEYNKDDFYNILISYSYEDVDIDYEEFILISVFFVVVMCGRKKKQVLLFQISYN